MIQVLTSDINELINSEDTPLYKFISLKRLEEYDDFDDQWFDLIIQHKSTNKYYCLEFAENTHTGCVLDPKAEWLIEVTPVEKTITIFVPVTKK